MPTRRFFIKQTIDIERRYLETDQNTYYDYFNFYDQTDTEIIRCNREDNYQKVSIWLTKSRFGEYEVEGYNITCKRCDKCAHNENGNGCLQMLHVPTLEQECYERKDFDDCIIKLDGNGENATGLPEDDQPEGKPF